MINLIKRVFGTSHEREIKRARPVVARINELEPAMMKLTDEQLRGMTAKYRERLERGEALQDLLPEAFATVREASRRVLGMRHYDVQMIGGMVLHRGAIAEMKTGEGKTLVATAPLYLNALEGRGCHLVTVNDYLATRDAEWMGGGGIVGGHLATIRRRRLPADQVVWMVLGVALFRNGPRHNG